jgi:uncharacterized membrane protein YgcG
MERTKRVPRWAIASATVLAVVLIAAGAAFAVNSTGFRDQPGESVGVAPVTVDVQTGSTAPPTSPTPTPSPTGAITVPAPTPLPADDHGGDNGNRGGGSGSGGSGGGGSGGHGSDG